MKKILILTFLLLSATVSAADIMFDLSSGYYSRGISGAASSHMENHLFLGMPVAVKEQLYIGANFTMTSDGSASGGDTTEIGVRTNFYMNADKNYLLMLAYNPYVSMGGSTDAYSYLVGVGYELKVNNNFFIGTAIVYHATTVGKDTTTTLTTTMPMVNISLRFK